MKLRPYQQTALDEIRSRLAQGIRTVVLMLATGGGKTAVASNVAQCAVARGNRVFFIVDSIELIDQAVGRFEADGLEVGVIQGNHWQTDYSRLVQVATIQTLKNRWAYLSRDLYPQLLIVDECHVLHDAHQKIIRECEAKGIPTIGLSATPFRKGLGKIFDDLVVGATTASLTRDGFLVPARCYAPDVPDLTGVKLDSNGDWASDALAKVMGTADLVGNVVDHWHRLAEGRKTIVFASNVAHSKHLQAEFERRGVRSAHIDGYMRDPEERERIIREFRSGDIEVLCNVAVLCLDSKTEILTSHGWKGISDYSDEPVANWSMDGSIEFREPDAVFRREKSPNERMVSLQTSGADFRVTEGHTMVVACGEGRESWKAVPASEVVGKRIAWPKHGVADPVALTPAPLVSAKQARARVRSLSYVYRGQGDDRDTALAKAREHVEYTTQPALSPSELTFAQCRFIGFWLADGCVSKGSRGGHIWSATQSKRYGRIVDWFDRVLSEAGIRSTKYDKGDHFTWTFVKGTGGSGQRLDGGIFRVIPYLDKTGSDYLWGFSRDQLIALLEGFWVGDGSHGQMLFDESRPAHHKIQGTQLPLYERLQAVGACRGIAATIKPVKRTDRWKDNWKDQYTFSFNLDQRTGSNAKVRPVFEGGVPGEMVWCVQTQSGYIVTRRNGIVTVMGNCKGFDAPETACVVLARPTKSLMLHIQMIGRGLRTAEGKTDCLILDHAGNVIRNGMPTDELPSELDDGTLDHNLDRRKKTTDRADRACSACGHVSAMHVCPACGFAPERRSDVDVVNGELKEITETQSEATRRNRLETRDQKARFLGQLLGHAQARGYREGWAKHKYRERYGVWPRGLNAQPLNPGVEVRNFIKHLQIRDAKRREAA